MPETRWHWLKEFRKLWEPPLPEPTFHATRIFKMQRTIVLPAKLVILLVVIYYLFFSQWMSNYLEGDPSRAAVFQTLQKLTVGFLLFNLAAVVILSLVRNFPVRWVHLLVLAMGLADGLFLAAMTLVTGGFESTLFWAFPCLIVLNAFSIPLAAPQIMLNLSLSVFYLVAGIWSANNVMNSPTVQQSTPARVISRQPGTSHFAESSAERARALALQTELHGIDTFLLRLIVLWLLTACCYGVQVLAARQRQVEEEAREFAARQGQLRTAGRLAAEIAHQVKNPLAIINNATFSLRRAIANGKTDVTQQLNIIQEEIERSDRIITQLMGYARLAEGRVEKINVTEEIDRALEEVFPNAVGYEVEVERNFASDLPFMVMQRGHLNSVLVNLLQNSREALEGKGRIQVDARSTPDQAVEITIRDDGPGIPSEQTERVFEAYYTTKNKGTGLGLAIVKHNVELYGGHVRVESGLGKGARFVLIFPARMLNESTKPA